MSAAVFTAKDARQRQHLLRAIGDALDNDRTVAITARHAYEGENTSVYLFTFLLVGYRSGRRRGREDARDELRASSSAGAVARAKARRRKGKPR